MPKSSELLLENLRRLMKERSMNQVALAQAMGISKQSVSQIMTGDNSPRLETIILIAKALSVAPFELLMSPEQQEKWKSMESAPTLEDRIRRLEERAHFDQAAVEADEDAKIARARELYARTQTKLKKKPSEG